MEQERLRIFDENHHWIGTDTREEVHKKGYWHETFHCWVVSKEDGKDYLHLQKRSSMKQEYPNLLDITAAGHILADETVQDGIREVHEEIGLQVSFEELKPLSVIKYSIEHEGFIDKELAHTFLYFNKDSIDLYELQFDEVSGIVKVEFSQLEELWLGSKEEVRIIGFEYDDAGKRINIDKTVTKQQFVPHELNYYKAIINLIKNQL